MNNRESFVPNKDIVTTSFVGSIREKALKFLEIIVFLRLHYKIEALLVTTSNLVDPG